MKSIIQEASSIAKAIQKSWEKAGKPTEFSIKILEEEEKNFIGLTKKPAKIAIFFTDKKTYPKKKRAIKKPVRETKSVEEKSPRRPKGYPDKKEGPAKKIQKVSLWSEEMVEAANKWTKGLLLQLKLPHVRFKVTKTRQNLKIHFNSPIIKDQNKQRLLFSNLSFLLMQSIRHKFKKTFVNLKTVLTSQ